MDTLTVCLIGLVLFTIGFAAGSFAMHKVLYKIIKYLVCQSNYWVCQSHYWKEKYDEISFKENDRSFFVRIDEKKKRYFWNN